MKKLIKKLIKALISLGLAGSSGLIVFYVLSELGITKDLSLPLSIALGTGVGVAFFKKRSLTIRLGGGGEK